MDSPLLTPLDALADWRAALDRGLAALLAQLDEAGLLGDADRAQAAALRQRLASDKLVLAFVAEFSRGKSELINALLFGGAGQRVLPAAPGRTTMCPVELGWDPQQPPGLLLLPIDSRLGGEPLAALRAQPARWQHWPLPRDDTGALAEALQQVMRTQQVPLDQARALGLWHDDRPDDNPPRDADDRVELPVWRHALVNVPQPLLVRGLQVLDTPGLNALGAEPELTLDLLPAAHATVFVLAADTGVTASDLAVWRGHLDARGGDALVVLNKADVLADPLLPPEAVAQQVQAQCARVAAALQVAPEQVFALSARQALAAQLRGDAAALQASGLPALVQALQGRLLSQRHAAVGRLVDDGLLALRQGALRRLAERQREAAAQLAELRGLRGKSEARLALLAGRVAADAEAFEQCAPRLAALRAVLVRQLQTVLAELDSGPLREALLPLQAQARGSVLQRGTARAYAELGRQLQARLDRAAAQSAELGPLLQAGQAALNADFGLALVTLPPPSLESARRALQQVLDGHGRQLGLARAWRLARPAELERFLRMLLDRLRQVFEGAAHEVEMWSRTAVAQLDDQGRERRQALAQRREAQARIREAEDGLEQSIATLAAEDQALRALAARIGDEVEALRRLAALPPAETAAPAPPAAATVDLELALDEPLAPLPAAPLAPPEATRA